MDILLMYVYFSTNVIFGDIFLARRPSARLTFFGSSNIFDKENKFDLMGVFRMPDEKWLDASEIDK